jgi:hypothetical protein
MAGTAARTSRFGVDRIAADEIDFSAVSDVAGTSVPVEVMGIGWLRNGGRHHDGASASGRRGATAVSRV